MDPLWIRCDDSHMGNRLLMTIELLAAALAIIATIVSATLVLAAKLTVLEVAIARLQVTVTQFEARIAALEKWRDV